MRRLSVGLWLVIFCFASQTPIGRGADFGLTPQAFGLDDKFGGAKTSPFVLREAPLLRATLAPETEAFAPGKPFKLILNLEHRQGTYSYWVNPGGPGVSTSVAWNLPKGFAVSGPEWPIPQQYRSGGFTSYVLKGHSSLVYTVTPPADVQVGDKVTLAGVVNSQVCTPKSCNPVKLDVKAELAIAPEPGGPVAEAGPDKNLFPDPVEGWAVAADEEEGRMILRLRPGAGANPDPGELYFFDSTSPRLRIDAGKPQKIEKDESGYRLILPMLAGETAKGGKLEGVLTAAKGWHAGDNAPDAFRLNLSVEGGGGRASTLRPMEGRNTALLLLFAFLGGLLLNVMPCVFPVIGLKIMGFAKQAHKDRRAVFLHGASYTAGVLLCFWSLAFLVVTMGRGWGAQLQSDWFMFFICHIFMIMSLNMAGVFEVGTPIANAGQTLNRREGLKRSFLTGILATITSTPCSAPFLGTALAYALSLPAHLAMGVFTLMGLGFAFPYLALSLFPNWLKKLPKPGPWMETFRQAMCFPLFATTAYLFWTMEAMLDEWRFLMFLFGLVLTAMACWLYGKGQKSRPRSPRLATWLVAVAVIVLGGGIWMGLPKTDKTLEWGVWSPEMVERLRREGRPVYVDFTARWCATCQVNKLVYQDKELAGTLVKKNVALLKADWTQYDDRITSTLKDEFDKAAVPVTVLYVPGKDEAEVLPEILTVSTVREALKTLP